MAPCITDSGYNTGFHITVYLGAAKLAMSLPPVNSGVKYRLSKQSAVKSTWLVEGAANVRAHGPMFGVPFC